jgi:gamma-glutamyltranspeptidase/glutathione hydrolase
MRRWRWATRWRWCTRPALAYAEKGFVLDAGDAALLATATDAFRQDPASATIFLNRGRPFEAGETLVQRDLARTLRAIAQRSSGGFRFGSGRLQPGRRRLDPPG